jgi:hypothetical protein
MPAALLALALLAAIVDPRLAEPVRPSPVGYDTPDQMLDIWIAPDGTWSWKDAHELPGSEQAGIFTRAESETIWAEGKRVVDSLDTLLPTGRETWQPAPCWPLPILPDGWDRMSTLLRDAAPGV